VATTTAKPSAVPVEAPEFRDPRFDKTLKKVQKRLTEAKADIDPALLELIIEAFLAEEPEDPILSISTQLTVRHHKVEIDGKEYDLKSIHDFGLVEQHEMIRDGQDFDRLWESRGRLRAKEGIRMQQLLDSLFERAIDAPPDVKKACNATQRRAVVQTFTYAPLATALDEAGVDLETAMTALEENPTTTS
jgi:hypothetical protein